MGSDANSQAERSKGLGASDGAPAAGMSRYKTQLGLFLEKTGQLPAQEESEPMLWGKLLEPVILAEFSRRTGLTVHSQQRRVRHPQHAWMWATLDAAITEHELVEAKTAGEWGAKDFGEPGTDEIPQEYILQCQHQLAVTGAAMVWVPVLVAGQELRVYRVDRNEDLIGSLVELEASFWRCVEARMPPAPDWVHPSTSSLIEAMNKPRDGSLVELGHDAIAMVAAYQMAKQSASSFEEEKAVAKAKLIHLMGNAARAVLPDGHVITRSLVTRKAYQVEQATYFDFRIRTPKGERTK